MARCRGTTRAGEPCRAPAGQDGFCNTHRPQPAAQAERQAARQRGGQAGAARSLAPGTLAVDFESPGLIRDLLAEVCRLVLEGQLDHRTANSAIVAMNSGLRAIADAAAQDGLTEKEARRAWQQWLKERKALYNLEIAVLFCKDAESQGADPSTWRQRAEEVLADHKPELGFPADYTTLTAEELANDSAEA